MHPIAAGAGSRLDDLDRRLLRLVQFSARTPQAELARSLGVSMSTVSERLRRLHGDGVIRDITARIEPAAVGLQVCAFVLVLVTDPALEATLVAAVVGMPEVQECHCVTGEFSYLLKVRVGTPADLESFLRERLKPLSGVRRTSTLVALVTAKETAALPLPETAHA